MAAASTVASMGEDVFEFLEALSPGVVSAIAQWAGQAAVAASEQSAREGAQLAPADGVGVGVSVGDLPGVTVDLTEHLLAAVAGLHGDHFAAAVQDLAELLGKVRGRPECVCDSVCASPCPAPPPQTAANPSHRTMLYRCRASAALRSVGVLSAEGCVPRAVSMWMAQVAAHSDPSLTVKVDEVLAYVAGVMVSIGQHMAAGTLGDAGVYVWWEAGWGVGLVGVGGRPRLHVAPLQHLLWRPLACWRAGDVAAVQQAHEALLHDFRDLLAELCPEFSPHVGAWLASATAAPDLTDDLIIALSQVVVERPEDAVDAIHPVLEKVTVILGREQVGECAS